MDCNEADPVVLEFDHVRGEKKGTISHAIHDFEHQALQDEILKCDVRCANCHRRKTAKDFDWYKEVSGGTSGIRTLD